MDKLDPWQELELERERLQTIVTIAKDAEVARLVVGEGASRVEVCFYQELPAPGKALAQISHTQRGVRDGDGPAATPVAQTDDRRGYAQLFPGGMPTFKAPGTLAADGVNDA